jgi:hypothetical protein
MMSYPYPARVVQKLQPAFDELLARDYLASVATIKVGEIVTRIKFVRTNTAPPALDGGLDALETAETALNDVEGVQGGSPDALTGLLATSGASERLESAWADILREFEIALPWESYRLIMNTRLLDIEDAEAVIGVTPAAQEWIERRLKKQVLSKLSLRLSVYVYQSTSR